MSEAATVTIAGVELVKAGTWAASTGAVTITPDDLADMVAAQADPEIDQGPIKLGHTGSLSALGDSEPALGWVSNLLLADEGTTLLGDLTEVPAGLGGCHPGRVQAPLRRDRLGRQDPGGLTYIGRSSTGSRSSVCRHRR